jgi:hypothetical protein
MLLLQVQECRPHHGWRWSGKPKYDHTPAVTLLSVATAAPRIFKLLTVIVVGNRLDTICRKRCFCCKFRSAGRIMDGDAGASQSLTIHQRSHLSQWLLQHLVALRIPTVFVVGSMLDIIFRISCFCCNLRNVGRIGDGETAASLSLTLHQRSDLLHWLLQHPVSPEISSAIVVGKSLDTIHTKATCVLQ